jgi:recombination protein RecA
LAQGRENAKDFLRDNPDLAEEIEIAVRNQAIGEAIPMADVEDYDDYDDEL